MSRPPVPHLHIADVARLLMDLVDLVDPVTAPGMAELLRDRPAVLFYACALLLEDDLGTSAISPTGSNRPAPTSPRS